VKGVQLKEGCPVPFARVRSFRVLAGLSIAVTLFPAAAGATPLQGKPIETHCVVFVVDQAESGALLTSAPDCFASSEEAAVAAAMPLPGLQSADLDASVNASSTFTLGIHYDGLNGTGSSITVVGSSCTGGYWNTPSWFDNRISSSYNGCYRLRHYDRPNKRGSATNTYGAGTTDNLASWMNNRTESVAYYGS